MISPVFCFPNVPQLQHREHTPPLGRCDFARHNIYTHIKLKRGSYFGSLRFRQYRDLRIHTLRDIKLKMAYFSRCIRGIKLELGMDKMLFAESPISLRSKGIGAPAVSRSEVHTRYGLENAPAAASRYVQ